MPPIPHTAPPRIAVIDPNTLSAIGMRVILEQAMPFAAIDIYYCSSDIPHALRESYAHYFAAGVEVLAHRDFYQRRATRTIVLTADPEVRTQGGLRCLCVGGSELQLVRALLQLHREGHAAMPHHTDTPAAEAAQKLSAREAEVCALIAKGLINKEIADRLHISTTTVITHRKNIMDKLRTKNVAALAIYAVMHGLVDVGEI